MLSWRKMLKCFAGYLKRHTGEYNIMVKWYQFRAEYVMRGDGIKHRKIHDERFYPEYFDLTKAIEEEVLAKIQRRDKDVAKMMVDSKISSLTKNIIRHLLFVRSMDIIDETVNGEVERQYGNSGDIKWLEARDYEGNIYVKKNPYFDEHFFKWENDKPEIDHKRLLKISGKIKKMANRIADSEYIYEVFASMRYIAGKYPEIWQTMRNETHFFVLAFKEFRGWSIGIPIPNRQSKSSPKLMRIDGKSHQMNASSGRCKVCGMTEVQIKNYGFDCCKKARK